MKNIPSLLAFFALLASISAIGSYFTIPQIEPWYATINRPSFSPPNWVFGPVWTTLYIMIAIAGWRIWNLLPQGNKFTNPIFAPYWAQLVFNCLWSIIFFGAHQIGLAAINIIALLISIAATVRNFHKHDKIAARLLYPYAAWVSFASLLNISIWQLN